LCCESEASLRDHFFRPHQRSITGLAPTSIDNAKELGPGLWVGFKATADRAGGGTGRRLLYSTHDHAKVPTFHDNRYAQWLDRVDNGVGDLSGETFLHLQPARVDFGNASELGQADDLSIGNVANMDDAAKGNHVMLTVVFEAMVVGKEWWRRSAIPTKTTTTTSTS
jgi:hypothetical protein